MEAGRAGVGTRIGVAAGALLLVALVAAIAAVSLWRGRQAAMAQAEARAANLALLVEGNVSSALGRAGVALGETAAQLERELAARGGIDRTALWSLVDAGTALVPEVARIGVFDASGQQVCGEPASRCMRLDLSGRDYFRDLRDRPDAGSRLYGPYDSRIDRERTLMMARPLRDGQQRFAGFVIAMIPERHLVRLLGAADLGEAGVAILRRDDLSQLVRVPPGPPGSDLAPPEALRRALASDPLQGTFLAVTPQDGIERQSAYRRLSGFSPYVTVGLATRDFLAPWRAEAFWIIGLLVLFTSSAAVVAWLVQRIAEDRRRIAQLYDHAPCGYHSIDRNGRYCRINATELDWLGCTRGEVIGKLGPVDFYTPEGAAAFRRHFPDFIERGYAEDLEFELVGRHGQRRRVLVSAAAVRDRNGQVVMTNSVMHDITELHEARQALQRQAAELEERVQQRTRELRALAAALDAAEARERRQLSRDLHDDLAQTLAAARIHLGALAFSAEAHARDVAERVGELIERANRSTRSLAAQLAPPMLDDLGLEPTLEWLALEIERTYGLKVTVRDDGQPKPLSHQARSILYRATRELLVNAAKHAHADLAEIELEREGADIVIRVRDSGVGFDPAKVRLGLDGQGLGLPSVRERMSFIGGDVEVHSVPGDGAVVVLRAPLTSGAAEAGEAGSARPGEAAAASR